jgi:hypothetical protein
MTSLKYKLVAIMVGWLFFWLGLIMITMPLVTKPTCPEALIITVPIGILIWIAGYSMITEMWSVKQF